MTSRLRAILGTSHRVKKKKRPSSPRRTSKPQSNTSSPGQAPYDDFTNDPEGPLPDAGLVTALVTDLTLRDVPQAMRYAQAHMFTPLPEQPASWGLGSARVAEVFGFRQGLPRVTTSAHLHGLLRSPTAVERETAELGRAGVVRKVIVLRRGRLLVEGGELDRMVKNSTALSDETKLAFSAWLAANPTKLKVPAADVHHKGGEGKLMPEQADQLVRAGFLTAYHDLDIGHVPSSFASPEDRGTLLSLAAVSRAATGSFAAVGGEGAIHSAGGSGGARSGGAESRSSGGATSDLSLAVPGQGAFLKLETAALAHLTSLLRRSNSTYGETTEDLLRERWDGGVAKWREFRGLAFAWVLHEAVGAGLVEVFETGSVGRGVRLLS
ncbi:hypothetical protein M406DRAFT_250296 [Cryphonectria parasitica EP155]|uniref:Serine-threonine protein kinase 19 n=1 Tax=Cryphonectria parasitica (strain ATCC 38755 / EP155) TaxID=660469 RepID=A0A9P4YAH7_CRYP1|nr:uncharacterized protein M406DRAFT_250296 [Cryphonectria parasitica EP155]KAF3769287.1 hypothetical protein M406DRAFT_250296 [Cryphonectria parasitica EP155]